MRKVVLAAAVLAGLVLAPRLFQRPDPTPALPRLMLWAWEHPEDLRFLDPGRAGVAFLARTVRLSAEGAASRPRMQPLFYPPGTRLLAVVRMESAGGGVPAPGDAVREALPAARLPGLDALQIDFDARRSEHAWYGLFLRELRKAMPPAMPLTITALESWCDGDRWIHGLPVADAVPMLFRMGPGGRIPADFRESVCRASLGVSTDELPARVPRGRRLYFFHPGPWTGQAYQAAVAQAARWER